MATAAVLSDTHEEDTAAARVSQQKLSSFYFGEILSNNTRETNDEC